jgi:hypothetical protein
MAEITLHRIGNTSRIGKYGGRYVQFRHGTFPESAI